MISALEKAEAIKFIINMRKFGHPPKDATNLPDDGWTMDDNGVWSAIESSAIFRARNNDNACLRLLAESMIRRFVSRLRK